MRAILPPIILLMCPYLVAAQQAAVAPRAVAVTTPPDDSAPYPRSLFNVAAESGATPFPYYQPTLIGSLLDKSREIDLQLFDIINEAAVRHDPKLKDALKFHELQLGYVPRLALAHYKWVFGDKSQLDWLLSEAKKEGLGRDSLILTVFGYMDEWDKTIRWLKLNNEYDDKNHSAAPGEIVSYAIETRKRLYGEERFQKEWDAVKTK